MAEEKARQARVKALQSLLAKPMHPDAALATLDRYLGVRQERPPESEDRSIAIVASAILEQGIETALATHFVEIGENELTKLFVGRGDQAPVLGSLYAKSMLAYALGVFGPQTLADCNVIRRVRNAFAHSKHDLSFSTPEIATMCKFNFVASSEDYLHLSAKMLSPREMFLNTIAFLYVYFCEHEIYDANRLRGPVLYRNDTLQGWYS